MKTPEQEEQEFIKRIAKNKKGKLINVIAWTDGNHSKMETHATSLTDAIRKRNFTNV